MGAARPRASPSVRENAMPFDAAAERGVAQLEVQHRAELGVSKLNDQW